MFHFTIKNRLKLASRGAEPLVICYLVNSNRMQSMYQMKHPTTWDMSHIKTLCFTTSDFTKTIPSQKHKSLPIKTKMAEFVSDYLFQKNQSPQAESRRTLTKNLLPIPKE